MFRTLRFIALTLCLGVSSTVVYGQRTEDIAKPVKTVVQAVRFDKDDQALKLFDAEAQGRFLLGDDWAKGTPAQRAEFTRLFQSLFAKITFPKVRDNFRNLASITYDNPVVNGAEATVGSVIIINHPMKKQEMKLTYTLAKQKEWKVVDVTVQGDSMLTGIRNDQVRPLLAEGGWNHLLDQMRKKEAELTKRR